jgi:hypothetical protein
MPTVTGVHIFANIIERCPFPYIDDNLLFKGKTFNGHLLILDEILKLIGKSILQVSAKKSRFCQEPIEYLGFKLNRMGYQPLPSCVSAFFLHQSTREHQANLSLSQSD